MASMALEREYEDYPKIILNKLNLELTLK